MSLRPSGPPAEADADVRAGAETGEESGRSGVKKAKDPACEPPDEVVVAEVLAGAKDRFEVLLNRYQDRVYRLVAGMVRDAGHADDLVQEVFLKAYAKLPEFAGKSRFYTWLYRIAVNRTLDFLKARQRQRAVSLEEAPPEPAASPQPLAPVLAEEFQAKLEEALRALPPQFRQVLVLREVEGLSYEEIARVMNCSRGTVESRLFRARAKLREKLKGYLR